MQNAVKVLIVEDEPHALMGLAELISGWGYRTETARDGIEGWEKTLSWEPAIVVTDLKMPRLDGLGLLTKLAEAGSGVATNVAVVLLTAQGSIQVAVDAMKLGAYDFLQKPVDAARLRAILANATRQRDTAIELEIARRRLRETGVLGSMVGSSRAMRDKNKFKMTRCRSGIASIMLKKRIFCVCGPCRSIFAYASSRTMKLIRNPSD